MCGGYTGEHEDVIMRTALVKGIPNWQDSKGPDMRYIVDLFKNDELFGTVDVSNHSRHYANDVAENWENGILKEDNVHITKPK